MSRVNVRLRRQKGGHPLNAGFAYTELEHRNVVERGETYGTPCMRQVINDLASSFVSKEFPFVEWLTHLPIVFTNSGSFFTRVRMSVYSCSDPFFANNFAAFVRTCTWYSWTLWSSGQASTNTSSSSTSFDGLGTQRANV